MIGHLQIASFGIGILVGFYIVFIIWLVHVHREVKRMLKQRRMKR